MVVKKERIVLTRDELDRIRAKVTEAPETDADARRRYLKKLSDERVCHWPNTLEAQRQKKENWKKQQEEEVEVKRRDVDRQEALLQRRLRAETIKRANDKLHEQTDKIKLLRSSLLYAEVIETRAEQIKEKLERHRQEDTLDAAYHKEMKRKVTEGEAEEEALRDARKSKERMIAIMQQEQLRANQATYIADLKREKEEGDQMKQAVKAAIEAEQQEAKDQKLKDQVEMEKMLAAHKDLKARRAERIAEELAYMEKCKQQRDVMDTAARARKHLEVKRFNERQAARQQMIENATRELEARKNAIDNKEEKEAKEQRKKEDDAEERKQQLRQERRAEIEKSRLIQIERHEAQESDRRAEDEIMKAYFEKRKAEINRLEKDDAAARLSREKKLRSSQQRQARERETKEMALEAYDTVNHARMLAAQGEENSRFKKIVHGYIDEFESQGRSTYLLHKALQHKNPIMFPAGKNKL